LAGEFKLQAKRAVGVLRDNRRVGVDYQPDTT